MAQLVFALAPWLCAAQTISSAHSAAAPGVAFFTNSAVHRFEVELSRENVASLRTAPREYVRATVRSGGQTYTNVGVHLKGVATFRPIDDQPSLTLNFSKFAPKQRFHGLRKIHLNNGKEDPTFLCEALSAEAFTRGGLPAPRVALSHTLLNGRDLGPYVAIEGFTEEFLARYFDDTRGNLYDSGFRNDITHPLERLLGKRPDNWLDLRQLALAAEATDLEQRWQLLARRLDTNAFANYLAMQVLISNWDGYALYRNNYRIYHDPESDRLFFIAHGMDQTFSRPLAPLLPTRWDGMVARAFMETREGRELFQQQLPVLFTNAYHTAAMIRRVDELAAKVRPLLVDQSPLAYDAQVSALRRRITQRGTFMAEQFSTTNWMNVPQTRTPVRRPPAASPLVR